MLLSSSTNRSLYRLLFIDILHFQREVERGPTVFSVFREYFAAVSDTDVIINLLGNLEIYTTNGVLREADLKSPLICKLLAYMLINKKAVIQPRHLIEALWPEGAIEADMSKNLRAVIFRLRQAFNLISNHQLIDSVTTGYCFNR